MHVIYAPIFAQMVEKEHRDRLQDAAGKGPDSEPCKRRPDGSKELSLSSLRIGGFIDFFVHII